METERVLALRIAKRLQEDRRSMRPPAADELRGVQRVKQKAEKRDAVMRERSPPPLPEEHEQRKEREQIPRGTEREAVAENQHPADREINRITRPKPKRRHDQTDRADGEGCQLRAMLHDALDRIVAHEILPARLQGGPG